MCCSTERSQVNVAARARPAAPSAVAASDRRPGARSGLHATRRRRPGRRSAPRRRRPRATPAGRSTTTAVPCAIASSTGRPKPSWRLGSTNRSAPRYSAPSRSAATGPASTMRGRDPLTRRPDALVGAEPAGRPHEHEAVRDSGLDGSREGVDHDRDVLARFERPDPQHVGLVAEAEALPRRRDRAVARDVVVDTVVDDGDPVASDGGVGGDLVRRRAGRCDHGVGAGGRCREALPVEASTVSRERVGEQDGRRVVHGDDEGNARHAAGPPAMWRARRRRRAASARAGWGRRCRTRSTARRGSAAAPGARRHRTSARTTQRRRRRRDAGDAPRTA